MALQSRQPATKPAKRKPANGAPVTAHPLFPAVVALWFGALFGLGSLAIRVGLLESLVLALRIDSVIPAAAPPLGISARILLALVLAAGGALLGATIARRIAAPKLEVHERKRKVSAGPADAVAVNRQDAHPDAPARKPISAHEELGEDHGKSPAFGDQPVGAPLAGRRRSALAIEADDTFELHEFAPLPGGTPQIHPIGNDDGEPLELDAFAESAGSFAPHADQLPEETTSRLDWSGNGPGNATPDFSPPADAVAGRQVFGMAAPQPDEVLDELGITDAEFEPLPAADSFTSATVIASDQPAPPHPDLKRPDLSTVPITDLAARLGEAMQRRRERAAQAATVVVAAPVATLAAFAPTPAATDAASTEQPDDDAVAVVTQSEPLSDSDAAFTRLPTYDRGLVAGFDHPNQIPAPQTALSAPFAPLAAVPSLPVFAPAAPALFVPQSSAVPALAESAETEAVTVAAIPAALRPLSFDGLDDDADDHGLPGFLPPRHFPGMQWNTPTPAAEPATEMEAEEAAEPAPDDKFSSLLDLGRASEPRQTFVRIEDPADAAPQVEPVVIFPGQALRSVEQAPGVNLGFGQAAAADPAEASFRQFDSPGSADQGQAITGPTVAPGDPAETERALRAALANLQRMSGAA